VAIIRRMFILECDRDSTASIGLITHD